MAPMTTSGIPTAADLDVIQNRVAVALAKRERLIKSWTALSARPQPPPKSQQELDEEDADLFNPTPAGLGLGAPVPKEFLDGDLKRREISSNDKLRRLMLGNKSSLQASKPRDAKDTTAGGKRIRGEESSDDDQGRSALGKSKKSKNGDKPNTTNFLCKDDGIRTEVKQVVKLTSHKSTPRESSHVVISEAESQVRPDKRADISQGKPSLHGGKFQGKGPKKPLVDYVSDDGSDQRCSPPISTISQKKESTNSSASFFSDTLANAVGSLGQSCTEQNRSDTVKKHGSTTPSTTDCVSGRQKMAELEVSPSHGGAAYTKKPSSMSGSSHSSKARASSTESEPSDMETTIPLSLTSDVIERTLLQTTDSTASCVEAKQARKRNRRAKRKERDRQRKALASGITNVKTEKLAIVSTDAVQKSSNASIIAVRKSATGSGSGLCKMALTPADGTGVAKKIKDRLLDANGN